MSQRRSVIPELGRPVADVPAGESVTALGVRAALVLLAATVAAAPGLQAQARRASWPAGVVVMLPAPETPVPFSAATRPSLPRQDGHPATHWKEGGAVGGILLGLAAAVLAHELCTHSESDGDDCGIKTAGGAALGAGVGFVVGALIGGLFPKGP